MLESLLADVLTRVLGQYLRGIDRENVNFGVWGGCLELRGLALRPEALAVLFETLGLELPVTVDAGFIGLLRIVVPWQTLASTPVRVYMERLTIVARPVRGDASDSSELVLRELRLMRAKLATDDAVREAAWSVMRDEALFQQQRQQQQQQAAAAPQGWAAKLITKIIENMQVELADIIIRFQDDVSDKRRPYVVALHCDNVKAVSADERWQEAYIDTPEHGSVTRKLISVSGFEVKWGALDTDRTSGVSNGNGNADNSSRRASEEKMDETASAHAAETPVPDHFESHSTLRAFVEQGSSLPEGEELGKQIGAASSSAVDSVPPNKRLRSIVPPFDGFMRVNLAKRHVVAAATVSSGDPSTSAVELDVQFPEISLELDDIQYASILQTSVYFARLTTKGFRPTTTRDWWMWSMEQILPGFRKRHAEALCLTPAGLRRRSKERQLYIATRTILLKARRTGIKPPPNMQAELENLESSISFDDVILYRDIVDGLVASIGKAWKLPTESTQAASSGTTASAFWSLLGYSTESSSATVDISTDQQGYVTSESEKVAEEAGAATATTGHGSTFDQQPDTGPKESVASSQRFAIPTFRAGILLRKICVRMSRGGYPIVSTPIVELVLEDLRVGVTTTSTSGILLEAVLGTLEARDLQASIPIVYPRVPWSPRPDIGSDMTKVHDATSKSGQIRAFEVAKEAALSSMAPSTSDKQLGLETMSSGGPLEIDNVHGLQIANSSYPTRVVDALEAIRSSVGGSSISGAQVSALGGADEGIHLETRLGPEGEDDISFSDERFLRSSAPLGDHCSCSSPETSHARACQQSSAAQSALVLDQVKFAPQSMAAFSSMRISPLEFMGSPNGRDDVDSLDYLIALRVRNEPIHDGNGSDTGEPGSSRLAVDVAVGRLEAIVDGPRGAFVWGLQFWQPKGKPDDPIMAFLGAAAGARVAELRMELESALLSRKIPMRIDAVICAPRFILPGRNEQSPALVANMGTFGMRSPVPAQEVHRVSNRSAPSERYSSYLLTLDDLGIYLAPSSKSAVSRQFTSQDASSKEGDVYLGLCDEFGLSPAKYSTNGVERIIRPFSLQLFLDVLQDAQVVQVAQHGRTHPLSATGRSPSTPSHIAKVRLRGNVPGIRLVLSQGACQQLLLMTKRWGNGLTSIRTKSYFDHHTEEQSSDAVETSSVLLRDQETSHLDVDGGQDGLFDASLAALDAKLQVSTVSLELRDRAGARIVTFVASGAHAKVLKIGFAELSADFQLQSWNVTDESRGTTAVFRHLAYAGQAFHTRGVSPPHTIVSYSPGQRESSRPIDDQESFLRVHYRLDFVSREKFVTLRFLSLNMVCVRETYVRIAAFFYGVLKEYKAAHSPEEPASRNEASTVIKKNLDIPVKTLNAPPPVGSQSPNSGGGRANSRGRLVVSAILDGFNLQLASAEGALAAFEMSNCSCKVELMTDGSTAISGDVGYFCTQDLTAPTEAHVCAIVYQSKHPSSSSASWTESSLMSGNRDGWFISIPPSGLGHSIFKAKFVGSKITYLHRFSGLLVRYISLLCDGLQPAIDEVRSAVEDAQGIHSTDDLGTSIGTLSNILFEILVGEISLCLPRHSSCPQESLSLQVERIHINNHATQMENYWSSVRFTMSSIVGHVDYESIHNITPRTGDRGVFLKLKEAELRLDMFPLNIRDSLRSDEGAMNVRLPETRAIPYIHGRLTACDGIAIEMCEAQYTVLYFVLTENFSESVTVDGTDYARKDIPNVLSMAGGASGNAGSADAVCQCSEIAIEGDDRRNIVARVYFQAPLAILTVARGWDISDKLCHVLQTRLRDFEGMVDLTSAGRIILELSSNIVDVTDIRQEALPDASVLVLPLVDDETMLPQQNSTAAHRVSNISLSYDKPYEERANIAIVLSNIQLSVIPELFRDLTFLAIPGWPFLASSAFAPDCEYLGRIVVLTLSKSQVWMGAEEYPGDTRALIISGDITARINWLRKIAAKKISVQAKRINLTLSYLRKSVVVEDKTTARVRHVALRVSDTDALVVYPGDASLDYVGPYVDNRGRRLEIVTEFVLCRVNVKETHLLAAIIRRLQDLKSSALSLRDWRQPNPLAPEAALEFQGNRGALAAVQALATRKTLTLQLSIPAARFLFTDESNGRFVPILELNVRNVVVQANMPRVVQIAVEVSVNLFNIDRGWWEPGLERWPVDVSFSAGESGSRALNINSSSKLDINVTPSTVSGAYRVGNAIRSAVLTSDLKLSDSLVSEDQKNIYPSGQGSVTRDRGPGSRQPSVAAFRVCNSLGRPVAMWLPRDLRRRPLRDGEEVDIDLPRDSLVPGAAEHSSADDNASRGLALRCTLLLEGYIPLELSAADVGAHVVTLSGDRDADSRSSLGSVVDKDALISSDAMFSRAIVWEVKMDNGVPVCTIRSLMRLVNETITHLEIRIYDDSDGKNEDDVDTSLFQNTSDAGITRIIKPGHSYSVPMHLSRNDIKIRPVIFEADSTEGTRRDSLDEMWDIMRQECYEDDNGLLDDPESSSSGRLPLESCAMDGELRTRLDHDSTEQGSRSFNDGRDNEKIGGRRLFDYSWSSPLPSVAWLRTTAREAIGSTQSSRKSSSGPGALFKALASGGSSRFASKLSRRAVCCRSTLPHSPDFYVAICPKVLVSAPGSSRATEGSLQWLDIGLQAPIVLENWLPGLLSFQIVARANRSDAAVHNQGHSENSRVAASGVVKPSDKVFVHSAGSDEKQMWMALAYRNDADVSRGMLPEDGSTPGRSLEIEPPTLFGGPVILASAISEKRGIFVEPRASSSSEGGQSRRDAKELCVRISRAAADSNILRVWSQYWIRNRSDVSLEICGRSSFYASGTAVRRLPPCPPGSMAHRFICFEGPYLSIRRGGGYDASDMVPPISSSMSGGASLSIVQEWWTYPSDLRETVKPVGIGIPGVALVMEVRPGAGPFGSTAVVTIRNSAWIVNRIPARLQWCKASSLDIQGNALLREVYTLAPNGSHSIHWDSKSESRSVNIRLAGSEQEGHSEWFWSPPVPISMGAEGEFPAKMYRPKTQEQYIARVVAVKLRGGSSSLYVHSEDRDNPPYRIVNLCQSRSIAFHQVGSEERPWLVRPGKSTRYSWDDPLASARRRELRVEVIESGSSDQGRGLNDMARTGYSDGDIGSSGALNPLSRSRDFHHAKFALNIDIVNDRALEKRDNFVPPLLASVAVDGATKTITFWDEIGMEVTDNAKSGTVLEATEASGCRAVVSPNDSDSDVRVPTVIWDDIGTGKSGSLSSPASPSHTGGLSDSPSCVTNVLEKRNLTERASDYPITTTRGSKSLQMEQVSDAHAVNVDVNMLLAGLGVSIVDATPLELSYVLASGVSAKYEQNGSNVELAFDVSNIQIDNQLPNAAYPVLMWSPVPLSLVRASSGDEDDISQPSRGLESTKTIAVEAKKSKTSNGIAMWKSVRAAVRPFDLALDEEFVLRIIAFAGELAKTSAEDQREIFFGADGEHIPLGAELGEMRAHISLNETRNTADESDVSEQPLSVGYTRTGLARIYIEELYLYPVKIFLSSTASRGSVSLTSAGYNSASVRTLVAVLLNVENCELDFAPLELRHLFDSSRHFLMLVKEYYLAQLNGQRLKLLTSNTLIGNPAALFDSVSIGARDLFVEPGKARGSAEFLTSVGRGSKSLISHTVGGIVGSIGGIPRAVASGLETAVGDREYLAERERIRGMQLPPGRGPLSGNTAQGMVTGAMSFAHGISSGVSGIFRDPVAGARRGGAAGFLRGVGKGLVGGVVKPVTGVMDLIAEPAAGMSKFGDQRKRGGYVMPVRPPRSFRNSGQRLVPFDLRSATGDALGKLVQMANSIVIEDEVLEWVELGGRPGRKDADAAELIWDTVQQYYRVMPGARRDRSQNRDMLGVASLGDGASAIDRPMKIRVAIVIESRVVIMTLDGELLSDIRLEPGRQFQLEDEDLDLVVLSVFPTSKGQVPEDSCASDVSANTENYVREFVRIPCGSIEARDDLHVAMDRVLVMLRQTSKRPKPRGPGHRRESLATELSSLPIGNSGNSQGTGIAHGSTESQEESPSSHMSPRGMPRRGPEGWSDNARRSSLASDSLGTEERTSDDSSVVASAHRKAELTSVVRRLCMGGTKRVMDAKRSVRVIIANALPSGMDLHLVRSSLDEGAWRQQPQGSIEPGRAVLFEADSGDKNDLSDFLRLNRDVRGKVTFAVEQIRSGSDDRGVQQAMMSFVNPSIGSPSYSVKCSRGLNGTYEHGNGAHATVVFTITVELPSTISLDSQNSALNSSRSSRDSLASAVSLQVASQPQSSSIASGSISLGSQTLASIGAMGAAGARALKSSSQRVRDAAAMSTAGSIQRSNDSTPVSKYSIDSGLDQSSSNRLGGTEGRACADPVALNQLVELGFDRELGELALVEANGDLVIAVDMLTRT